MRDSPREKGYEHCVFCTECGSHHGLLYRCPTYDEHDLAMVEVQRTQLLIMATHDPVANLIVSLFGL